MYVELIKHMKLYGLFFFHLSVRIRMFREANIESAYFLENDRKFKKKKKKIVIKQHVDFISFMFGAQYRQELKKNQRTLVSSRFYYGSFKKTRQIEMGSATLEIASAEGSEKEKKRKGCV